MPDLYQGGWEADLAAGAFRRASIGDSPIECSGVHQEVCTTSRLSIPYYLPAISAAVRRLSEATRDQNRGYSNNVDYHLTHEARTCFGWISGQNEWLDP